jgi:hypothetical protein
MSIEPEDGTLLAGIPAVVVVRAQQDLDFAVRLLNRETRDDALREAGVEEGLLERVSTRLDEVATMSFQDALQDLRGVGVRAFD